MAASSDKEAFSAAAALPFWSRTLAVEPDWIDDNGHLNMAYYGVLFDRAADELWDTVGLGPTYRSTQNSSIFSAECHLRYIRELHLGDLVRISIIIVAADEKRLHTFKQLHHATDGWLSATSENMSLHVTLSGPKVHAFPSDIHDRIQNLLDAHRTIVCPDGIGRRIDMRSNGPLRKPLTNGTL